MNEQQWPSHLPDADEAREWITSVLPGHPEVVGPTTIYAAYNSPPDVRVTARFQVTGQQTRPLSDVVFRANYFPLLASSARVHAFLSRHCRGVVPEVLAWQEVDGGSYLLYRAFEGEIVEKTRSLDALIETARTLAQIQAAVAIAPEQEKADLPRLPVEQIPALFAEMLANIRARYETVWAADDGTLSKWMPFAASEVLTRLEPMQAQVEEWSGELASGSWPETIVHGDLHTGNAVVQPNGSVLIYDWDDAVLSHPFLSVERLLVGAWQMDTNGGARAVGLCRRNTEPGSGSGQPIWTPSRGERDLNESAPSTLPCVLLSSKKCTMSGNGRRAWAGKTATRSGRHNSSAVCGSTPHG